MALSDLVDMELKLNRKPKFELIDIDDIIPNPHNIKKRVRNIVELANNIKDFGLMKPLEVYYDQEKEKYVLLGGERRYTALKILVDGGAYDPDIPCLVYKVLDDTSALIQLHMSNAQETFTDDEKVQITKDLLYALNKNPNLKKKGVPTVEWLAPFLGCSPRTAQKYKNSAEGKVNKSEGREQSFKLREISKEIEKICQCKIKMTNKSITFKCLNDEDLNRLLDQLGIQSELNKLT